MKRSIAVVATTAALTIPLVALAGTPAQASAPSKLIGVTVLAPLSVGLPSGQVVESSQTDCVGGAGCQYSEVDVKDAHGTSIAVLHIEVGKMRSSKAAKARVAEVAADVSARLNFSIARKNIKIDGRRATRYLVSGSVHVGNGDLTTRAIGVAYDQRLVMISASSLTSVSDPAVLQKAAIKFARKPAKKFPALGIRSGYLPSI